MNILPNSEEVTSIESQQHFVKIVDFLLVELVGNSFELKTSIEDNGNFKISISGLPSESKKVYRVNYDISLFRMIYDVLYVILSNDKLFPGIGYSSSTFEIPTIEVPSWALLDAAMSVNEAIYFDEERKELHSYIYTMCLHFMVRHEIRHIANGHIDYLLGRNISEFVESSNNKLSSIDNQTIEMDVDSCVSVGFIAGLLEIPEQLEHVPVKLRSFESLFESFLFILKILFYCLPSKKVSSLAEAQKSSHPNSTMRYFYSFTACLSYIEEFHPNFYEPFGKIYQVTFSFFDIIKEQGIFNFDRYLKDYLWSMSDEGIEHANSIWNNWDRWIPLLKPYALLKLAPPQNAGANTPGSTGPVEY